MSRELDLGGPVLGIETSCDETSAGVVQCDRLLGHVVASQDAHRVFGGVVPEIAARAHLRRMDAVVRSALEEADVEPAALGGVGVTAGPGLVGALLVGVNWAKGFAWGWGLPLLGVHHMEAHLFANSLEDPEGVPPFVALLVSGGHTLLLYARSWGEYRLLGRTRDDAAGEAFDKAARRIGLGYPGGPEIEAAARNGTPGRYTLPRPMLSSGTSPSDPAHYDFSFSGLKTALSLEAGRIEEEGKEALEAARDDLAAEFQEAVAEVLVAKTLRAVETTGCARVLLGGGVACNGRLREMLRQELGEGGSLHAPSARLSTDNGAMIARLAEHRLVRGERSGWELNADPNLPFPGLVRDAAPLVPAGESG